MRAFFEMLVCHAMLLSWRASPPTLRECRVHTEAKLATSWRQKGGVAQLVPLYSHARHPQPRRGHRAGIAIAGAIALKVLHWGSRRAPRRSRLRELRHQRAASLRAVANPDLEMLCELVRLVGLPEVLTDPGNPQAASLAKAQADSAQVSGSVPEEVAPFSKLLELMNDDALTRIDLYDSGKVASVQIGDGGELERYAFDLPGLTPNFISTLVEHGVTIAVHRPQDSSVEPYVMVLYLLAYFALMGASIRWLTKHILGRLGFKSRAEVQMEPNTGVSLNDVAGIDEAKEEIADIISFLRTPERFAAVGARAPRGILLTGLPGTGKTFAARALAGEAGVPIIQVSAAEFVERFVGVGASRVRDIFHKARTNAPCIVFIDELDAIGKMRQNGSHAGGKSATEREQTLNQILCEMDGFQSQSHNVIVVAATNHAHTLDEALLRPGRFDRQITLDLPTLEGRKQILAVHAANKRFASGVDFAQVARNTVGFSGAELANLVNESAILAVRRDKPHITTGELDEALDRVSVGISERRPVVGERFRKVLAYYQAGQSLVRLLLADHDAVRRVTLMQPRHNVKSASMRLMGDSQFVSHRELKVSITGLLGGRAAEMVVFGPRCVTSAASKDLQAAEKLARSMVTRYGMSALGSISIDDGELPGTAYSENLAHLIDSAVSGITNSCFDDASALLSEHRACLDRIASELLEYEELSGTRLEEIIGSFAQLPALCSIK